MVLKSPAFGSMIFLLFVTGSLPGLGNAAAFGCRGKTRAFLSGPSKAGLNALSGDTDCWNVVGLSNANLNQLNNWVDRGNRWAAQYLAKHLKQLDGGNLEDSLVALGQFSDHDMEHFLLLAKNGLLSKRELTDSLTMLPLSLTDNPQAQLDLLSTRKAKVMRVARRDLSKQKAQALSAIDDFAAEIRLKNPRDDR